MTRNDHGDDGRSTSADVVLVGGGVIGMAIAFFLAESDDFDGSVVVVERDPTYQDSSTARSVGGFRQQFSTPENIEIGKYGARFFAEAGARLEVDGDRPDLSLHDAGYLLLASPSGLTILEENLRLQAEHAVAARFLDPEELSRRFPWLHVEDLAGGGFGASGEGWLDPYSLMMALRRKALSLGVTVLEGQVTDILRDERHVLGVEIDAEHRIHAPHVVNAAGPRAADVVTMAGLGDLPVRRRKRLVFTFRSPAELPGCPLVVDPSGVYFRPEGDRFLCGVSPAEDRDPDCAADDFSLDAELFEEEIWPRLAARVPALDELRPGTSWAGHYAVNTRDQNAILGPHPELEGFFLANGFSGHGLQQAPAVGRALAEWITYGEPRSLDLRRFSIERFDRGELLIERCVI